MSKKLYQSSNNIPISVNYLKQSAFRTKHLLVASLLLLVSVGLVACSGSTSNGQEASGEGSFQVGEPVSDSTLAAVVQSDAGTDTLTMQEYQSQLQNMMRRMPQAKGQMDQVRRQMIEQFVNRHALLAEAERRNVTVAEDSVEQRFQQIHGQFPNDAAFKKFLAQQGVTVEELRNELRESFLIQNLVDQVSEEETETPSDQEIEQYQKEQSEEVSAQHILFRVDAEEDSAVVRNEAQAVLDSALAGVDFSGLAERHSEGPSAERGGNLDYFSRDQMVPPFSEAAFALADSGDVADELVETQFGYHIIRLTGRRTVDTMESAEAEQRLAQERQREAVTNLIDELRPNVTVRVNPEVVDPAQLQ
jgi:peptidyl-prolyl cis-trans isomerase C